MKTQHLFIFIGFGAAICGGIYCNKIKAPSNSRQTDNTTQLARGFGALFVDSATVNSYVLVNINQHVDNKVDSSFQVAAVAAFTDSVTHTMASTTSIAINGTVVTPGSTGAFALNYTDSSGSLPAQGKALAGTNVTIKVTGSSSADTVSQTIYMPKDVLRTTGDFPPAESGGPDNTKSLTLNWTPDTTTATKNVIIQVSYYDGLSHSADTSLNTHINTLTYVVTDNGSYTISASDMSTFPTNCYIGISIGRGTQQYAVLPVSQKRVFFWTISSVSSIPLQVNNL